MAMDSVDLDSLLQSHGEISSDDESSSEPDSRHHRTVEEILLNHSSSSPSPPSSPSYSTDRNFLQYKEDDAVLTSSSTSNSSDPVISMTNSSVILSERYSSATIDRNAAGSVSNRISERGRVLPQLFGGGVMRSHAKPGAALAAATAASRSIPTPHATAIKLRRRATIGNNMQTRLSTASDDSFLSSPARASENGSAVENDLDEVGSAVFSCNSQSGESYPVTEKEESVKNSVREEAEVSIIGKTMNELGEEDASDFMDTVFTMSNSESHVSLPVDVDNEKDLENVNLSEEGLSHSLSEKKDVIPHVLPNDGSDDINEEVVAALISDGNATAGEEASDIDIEAEPEGSDDSSSQSDVAYIVDCENRSGDTDLQIVSHATLKALDLAEEVEKKQAFTALHYEEGAAAQPMRLDGLRKGSTVLGYFDVTSNNAITRAISSQVFRRDHGSPQVVAVHLRYIAIGMSKGSIYVIPSKYTAHHVDNMDPKMTSYALQGDKSLVPVTSMCFNQQGDLLFAGYGDGHCTIWDVEKVSALKVVTEHRAPVVHMIYLGLDTQNANKFNVVSGDSKGVVKLLTFSVPSFSWNQRYSITKSAKLFDETTGRVVCASPLICTDSHGGTMTPSQGSASVSTSTGGSMMGGGVDQGVVIFIMHQFALVAQVISEVKVYAQLPKPDGVRNGAMPYAAWRCVSQSPSSSAENSPSKTLGKVPLLAIAWERSMQVAKLVNSKLNVIMKWTLENPAIGLAWLDDQMLVVLTSIAQLILFDIDGNVIHQTSFCIDGFLGNDLTSHHIYFTNALGDPEKAYHNSVAVRGSTIYILGLEHLVVARFLSWKERIEVLRRAGDWMGALNMSMTLYDGKSHGIIDLPRNLDGIRRTIMPYLVELLQSYVGEVFSYLSVAYGNENSKLTQSDEIKEQYTRAGGVAVEFCVHIRRTDVLFDDIVSKFDVAHQKETFFELLEPYILKDMLGMLPPEIMQGLVEHYSKKGWLQRIEQCVLHMDIMSLDFNQVVLLCREHRLHGALIYLFNKGLDDFRSPLEELLAVLGNNQREGAASLGYRILVYLKYCFQGLAFPPGHGHLSPMRLPSLRKELLLFLLEASPSPNTGLTSLQPDRAYVNLVHLLELDTEATLDVLRCAFSESKVPTSTDSEDSTNFVTESAESQKLIQNIVDVLAEILDANFFQTGNPISSNDSVGIWPSKQDVCHIYDFIAWYVACEQANISKDIFCQIMEYLTAEVCISHDMPEETIKTVKQREKQLLSLLIVVPETQWDHPYLLHLCEKAQFHKVCGYIHAIGHQYIAALESYMKATDEPIYAFSFIHNMFKQLNNEEADAFELAVLSRIPDLVKLNREGTYLLIFSHLLGKSQDVMSNLHSHPESLFLYLKTAIEVQKTGILDLSCLEKVGTSDFRCSRRAQQQSTSIQAYLEAISIASKHVRENAVQATDEMTEQYFELLCRYDRDSVLKFLETSESYRVDVCLRLCQEYGIIDAASFLFERVGDVGNALELILSNLNEKFSMLDAELQKRPSAFRLDNLNALMKKKEVHEILEIVHACIGLCQRNSTRLKPDESEFLWFQLLDSFCLPLTNSGKARTTESGRQVVKEDEEVHNVKSKPSRKSVRKMRKLLSLFIKEIVEGMVGYIRLQEVMPKLLTENGSQEFGDFKIMILSMLGTYDFERKILDTAKILIEDDTYYTMSLLTKGASHGYAPRSLVCCICNTSLAKNSSDSRIQVFSCGHAIHVQCGVQENEGLSRVTLSRCPICAPRKKSQISSGKSVITENGLVSNSLSRSQQSRTAPALYPHEQDGLDYSYGSHSTPRFELLNSLQGNQKLLAQVDNMPQLRLAPPAVYNETARKRMNDKVRGETSTSMREQPSRTRQLKDVKVKKSSHARFQLKSSIFGKEKISRR